MKMKTIEGGGRYENSHESEYSLRFWATVFLVTERGKVTYLLRCGS